MLQRTKVHAALLTAIAQCFGTHLGLGEETILIPPKPRQVAPPKNPQKKLERHKRRRQPPPVREVKPPAEKKRKPRVMNGKQSIMFSTNYTVSAIQTSGDREGFTSEPSPHFRWLWRPFDLGFGSSWFFWTGVRIASFSGVGVYRKVAGRYAFNYIGPTFALGKLYLRETKRGRIKGAKSGLIWQMGVSLQSRQGKTDDTTEPLDNEFDVKKTLVFDPPGLWTEVSYIDFKGEGFSVNYDFGAQMGEGKTFVWLGVGVGGWY